MAISFKPYYKSDNLIGEGTVKFRPYTATKSVEVYTDCLTFTGKTSDFTLKATNKTWNGTLEWSTDHNTWTTLAGTEAMQSVDKKLYLRGKGNTGFYKDAGDYSKGVQWILSALANCTGNIQTLLDWKNPPTSVSTNCYRKMFCECANLATAPELPATTLAKSCYYAMFYKCSNLTTAAALPADFLREFCYNSMFDGCTKLKVNTTSGNKIFTCSSYIPNGAVTQMFEYVPNTPYGTPTAGNTYYWTE